MSLTMAFIPVLKCLTVIIEVHNGGISNAQDVFCLFEIENIFKNA